MNKTIITGYYGCSCHPYSSWEECEKLHKQRVAIGQSVQQRHTECFGIVHLLHEEKDWCMVKYGDLPRDLHLENVANLLIINSSIQ